MTGWRRSQPREGLWTTLCTDPIQASNKVVATSCKHLIKLSYLSIIAKLDRIRPAWG